MNNTFKKTANILVLFALRLFVKYFVTEYDSSIHITKYTNIRIS